MYKEFVCFLRRVKLSDSQLCLFQIDIFEQQFRSISKIDFMERYLSEVKKKRSKLSVKFFHDDQMECKQFKLSNLPTEEVIFTSRNSRRSASVNLLHEEV